MSTPRKLALLCFLAGAFILVQQVIFRTSGEPLASYKLERTANERQFESMVFSWPEGTTAELFLVIQRNRTFENRRSYLNPTIQVFDTAGQSLFQNETSELHNKGRMRGRTIFFTAGPAQLNGSDNYRAVAILSQEMAALGNMEVHLELRPLRAPIRQLTVLGFVFFCIGMGGLILTRPK